MPAKRSNDKDLFSIRELSVALNNAAVASLRPASLGEIPEERLRKLRNYMQAAVAPMLDHVEEEFLRPEELVAVLATGALFVHTTRVAQTDKLPAVKLAKECYDNSRSETTTVV